MTAESPRNKSITAAPANKSPLARPTCKTCGYHDAAAATCNRNPLPIPARVADDWCGEHPDFPDYLKSLKAK